MPNAYGNKRPKMVNPLTDVRQHLNEALSRRNAIQKIRLKLAESYAQMGYAGPAQQQLAAVPVVSARVRGDLICRLIQVGDAIDANQLLVCAARAASCGSQHSGRD